MSEAKCYTWRGTKTEPLDVDPSEGVGIELPDGRRLLLGYNAKENVVTLSTDTGYLLSIRPLASNFVRVSVED